MRNPIRPGFGLPGGKVGVIDSVSFTVKCLIFSQDGILIVKEKNPQNKSQEERKKEALSFKEIKHRIWKMNARRKDKSDCPVDEKLLQETIQRIENGKENKIILLSAVREIIEETGILIYPKIITKFALRSDNLFSHNVVLCLGEIISGKLKKESCETFNNFLRLYDLPPTEGERAAENTSRTELMYYRHKIIYLPSALKILLNENYAFPFPKMEIEDFLKDTAPA